MSLSCFRHCEFAQHVREQLDENGGFEECATSGKECFSGFKLMPHRIRIKVNTYFNTST